MKTRAGAILVVLISLLIQRSPALSQEPPFERVLSEIHEQLASMRGWVEDRLAEVERRLEQRPLEPPLEPLPQPLELVFAPDTDRGQVSVVTAVPYYRVASRISSDEQQGRPGAEETAAVVNMALHAEGEIHQSDDGRYVVTCRGEMHRATNEQQHGDERGHANSASEHAIEFASSVILKPGESYVIARQEGLTLRLTLNPAFPADTED